MVLRTTANELLWWLEADASAAAVIVIVVFVPLPPSLDIANRNMSLDMF